MPNNLMSISDRNSCNNTNRLNNSNDNVYSLENEYALQHGGITWSSIKIWYFPALEIIPPFDLFFWVENYYCSCCDSIYLLEKMGRSFISFPFLCIICDWITYIKMITMCTRTPFMHAPVFSRFILTEYVCVW